jgi:hypothetical protein
MTDRTAIRTQDDLIEAFRAAKDRLGLSNAWCDDIGGFTRGQTDKVLGPTRAKGLSPMLLQTYCALFAVRLEMVVDVDQARVMEARWEGRDISNVRMDSGRISKKLVERAKPAVLKAAGAAGGKARAMVLSARQQSQIGLKGAKARARLPKAVRSEISRKGWIKRRKTKTAFPLPAATALSGAVLEHRPEGLLPNAARSGAIAPPAGRPRLA